MDQRQPLKAGHRQEGVGASFVIDELAIRQNARPGVVIPLLETSMGVRPRRIPRQDSCLPQRQPGLTNPGGAVFTLRQR